MCFKVCLIFVFKVCLINVFILCVVCTFKLWLIYVWLCVLFMFWKCVCCVFSHLSDLSFKSVNWQNCFTVYTWEYIFVIYYSYPIFKLSIILLSCNRFMISESIHQNNIYLYIKIILLTQFHQHIAKTDSFLSTHKINILSTNHILFTHIHTHIISTK